MSVQTATAYFKLATININRIKNRRLELIDFVERNEIDVLLVQETWLKGERFSFPNYTIFRNDRLNRPGGGTMIFVKKHISAQIVPGPENCTHIEGTFISIKFKGNKRVYLGSVYCSPSIGFTGNCLEKIFGNNNTTIIGGDLNAKHRIWGCRTNNARGLSLFQFSEILNYHILPPEEHTHISGRGLPDILDIFVIKNSVQVSQPIVVCDLSSDHLPVLLEVGNPLERGRAFVSRTKTNWMQYKNILQGKEPLQMIQNDQDIENAVNEVTDSINVALAQSSTTKVSVYSKYGALTDEIKQKIRIKNRLKNRAFRTGDPRIKAEANREANIIKQMLIDRQSELWENKIQDLNIEDNSIFKMTKTLTKGIRKPVSHLKNQIGGQTLVLVDPGDKAELFADTLYEQFSENPSTNPQKDERVLRTIEIYKTIDLPTQNYTEVTINDVKSILNFLNPKKAPGFDGIKNAALRNLPDKTVGDIASISQAIFKTGYFPCAWKKAKVILIYKKGEDPTSATSYRPISLLSGLGKVVERLVLSRINSFVFEQNILPNEQFGFRSEHCTIRQTTRLTSNILKGFNKRTHTGAVFFDVSKAFDKVWHNGLLLKLIRIGTPNYLIKLVASFLENRSFAVSSENAISNIKHIRAGVPQGSPLSPMLYNIYTHDIPKDRYTQLYLFADDTAITSTSKQPRLIVMRLQRHIAKLEEWLSTWKIHLNPSKTKAIYFSKSNVSRPESMLRVNRVEVNWCQEVKYLGLIFDQRLNWRRNSLNRVRLALNQLNSIYPLLNRRSRIANRTKVNLYKVLVRPVLTYGVPSWCNISRTELNKFQVIQNRALKIIANAPRYAINRVLHNDFHIPTLNDFFLKIITNYYRRTDLSTNDLITDSHTRAQPNSTYKLPKDWLPIVPAQQ